VAGIAIMKLRSCLLIACMAVVPVLAMFSHKIPRDWRLAAQRFVRGEGFARVESVARGGELTRVEEPAPSGEPAVPLVAAPAPTPPTPLPTTGVVMSSGFSPSQDDPAVVRAEVERQLAALGAVSFECVRIPTGGQHRCSCRVSADPSGQLHRVFQSSNPDPTVALKNLLGQVQFWKHRLANQPVSGPGLERR
jgi:hypothetical protein